jgi:very-short-patch-repair endonuclease
MSPRRVKLKSYLRARILRQNLTEAEKKLWTRLRAHRLAGAGFRRQHPIGIYIVDFCAPREKIIIELDGDQHGKQKEYDELRTAFLREKGYRVLRFWNGEVMRNINGVLETILNCLQDRVVENGGPFPE